MLISITIPGEPHAQQRHRSRVAYNSAGQPFVQTYDAPESRAWKKRAAAFVRKAMEDAGMARQLLDYPVYCVITAVFSCPLSDYRKAQPTPRRVHAKRPDGDNIAKAVKDSLNGSIVVDDSRIVQTTVRKIIGAQGEAPLVHVMLTDEAPASVAQLLAPKEPDLFAQRSA